MSAVIELLTGLGVDPVSVLIDLGILNYLRRIEGDLSAEIDRNRERTARLESSHIDQPEG